MESINWTQEQMLEVTLKEPDDFLKVRETLSRIGVASRKERTLYQSCHILHKQGKYYICGVFKGFSRAYLGILDAQKPNCYANLIFNI